MKLKSSLMLCAAAAAIVFGSGMSAQAQAKPAAKCQDMKQATPGKHDECAVPYTIKVGGVHCEGCMESIKADLTKVTGVEEVKTSFKAKTVTVWICPHKNVKTSTITAKIKKIGYSVVSIKQGKA